VRIAVDLLIAGEQEGPSKTRLGIRAALIDVHRDHADRAGNAGTRDIKPVGRAGDCVCRGQRALVGYGPEWLVARGFVGTDLLD
jgi:hypothetical protein